MEGFDRHHILWSRRRWKKGWAGKLRSFWYLRIAIPVSLHRHIHTLMNGIPRPNEALCESALYQFHYLEEHQVLHKTDGIEKRIELLIAVLDTGDSETVKALKQQLAIIKGR